MAGRITPQFKDDLLARTSILDVVGTRVPLKKAGTVYKACCPFHDEKTPSFTVTESRQTYHCFGCGAHGNAIDFLMGLDRLSFPEAIEELAARVGLEIPGGDRDVAKGPNLRPLYDLLEQTADLYRRQLREHPDSQRAVDYLKGRGLTGEIAGRYGVGFAPPAWDFVLSRLGEGASARERLIEAGLITAQDGKRYDRFRDRIMFPIRDRRGRVVGFGGRVLRDGEPKYLNSPETAVFHKGRELYGLYEAQQARRRLERLLVVEGYMDVISLAQFGIDYVVATLGTATTADHLRLLMRSTPELVFCFDGDRAGRDAAWKALETSLEHVNGYQSLRFLFLPEGEDPDTLVRRQGREAFEREIENALPLSDFLFDELKRQVGNVFSDNGRRRLKDLATSLINDNHVPAGSYREMLENRLAFETQSHLERKSMPRPRRQRVEVRRPTRPTRIAQAIALLLDHPELVIQTVVQDDDWRRLDSPGVAILSQILEMLAADPTLNSAKLIERWRDHEHYEYLKRLSKEPFLRDIPEDGLAAELIGALQGLSKEVRDAERLRPLNWRSTADWSDEMREQMDREAEQARTRRR